MDILWHSDRVFRKAERLGPQPDWNGFMENIAADCRYAPQKITIGMSPPTSTLVMKVTLFNFALY